MSLLFKPHLPFLGYSHLCGISSAELLLRSSEVRLVAYMRDMHHGAFIPQNWLLAVSYFATLVWCWDAFICGVWYDLSPPKIIAVRILRKRVSALSVFEDVTCRGKRCLTLDESSQLQATRPEKLHDPCLSATQMRNGRYCIASGGLIGLGAAECRGEGGLGSSLICRLLRVCCN